MPKKGSGRQRFRPGGSGRKGSARALTPAGAEIKASESELIVTVMDAGAPSGRQSFDCSKWLVLPSLAIEFANALPRVLTKRNTPRTKQQLVYDLGHGFFAFCSTLPSGSTMDSSHLTQELVTNFAAHLQRARSEDGSPRYAIWTRRHYLGALRSALEVLRAAGRLEGDITVPSIKGHGAPKTKPMDRSDYLRFIAVCLADVTQCMTEVSSAWNQVGERVEPSPSAACSSSLARAVSAAMDKYSILPERQWLKVHDKELFAQVDGEYQAVMKVMHPMSQHLTPFIYYLAAITLYNTQPLLEMRLEDAIETSILGVARLSLHPFKTRGKQYQHRSFVLTDELDNPAVIIRYLVRWTDRLRDAVPARYRSQLFVYVCRNRGNAQFAFPLYERDKGFSPKFAANAARYCKEKGFPSVGTRLLRATGADLAHELFDGDPLSVGALLGHVGVASMVTAYRSDDAKRRDEDRLAGAMAARERWLNSRGKSDARRESADADRSAATPGFTCIDPFNSPIPGEKPDRLCAAYGFCPDCPLAQPDANVAYTVARLLQLRERLLEARDRHGIAVWRTRFSDQLDAINLVWMPTLADEETLNLAALMQLNPLPPID